ncbi:MAG: sirohydrochlorin chelatase [Pyrinomonadaceae bacterium]
MMNFRIAAAIICFTFASSFGIIAQDDHAGHHPEPVARPANAGKITGVLLLAHGGKETWNEEVRKIAAAVNKTTPVEVAFGMATKRNIQNAADNLVRRGAAEIVAVPLFVSSHSSVITSTEYLLGLRKDAPAALAIFAKMDHGHGGHDQHTSEDTKLDPTTPINSAVPIRMTPALNRHYLVAEILSSRAAAISREPLKEVVVIVAHGPVSDQENSKWLADMEVLAKQMADKHEFKRIEYLTVRDDAPEAIRSSATGDLRRIAEKAVAEGNSVLIVPLLLSYGGIEEGVKKRLEGIPYRITGQGLLPDERLAQWVIESIGEAGNGVKPRH